MADTPKDQKKLQLVDDCRFNSTRLIAGFQGFVQEETAEIITGSAESKPERLISQEMSKYLTS